MGTNADLICDVCNGESGTAIGVACSSLGAISFAYCRPCLVTNAERAELQRSDDKYASRDFSDEMSSLVPEARSCAASEDA